MTEKTKKELINEAWNEFYENKKPIEDEYKKKIKTFFDEYDKKRKEIEEKFKNKCEVCGE